MAQGSSLPQHRARTHARARDESGAAVVEFALILPVILALVFGIISYAYMLSYRQAVTQAAVEGARSAAVAPAGASLPGRVLSAVNRSLDGYGVACTAGGALVQGGKTVGTCAIPSATIACPAPNPASTRCVRVTVRHSY